MLAEKPVIGSRSGGTTELITEGVNGMLYTPGDFGDLAEKIEYLQANPDEMARMGSNGKSWASCMFSGDRYRNELLELVSSIPTKKNLKRSWIRTSLRK
jgi:glycosyltransferase involved in cell wall biosynthesis